MEGVLTFLPSPSSFFFSFPYGGGGQGGYFPHCGCQSSPMFDFLASPTGQFFFLPNTAVAHVSVTVAQYSSMKSAPKSILSYKIPKIPSGREKAPPQSLPHVY